jgi:hypothetical protein
MKAILLFWLVCFETKGFIIVLLSKKEPAIWQDFESQVTTSVERWEGESALTKSSVKLPLYPSLVSGILLLFFMFIVTA